MKLIDALNPAMRAAFGIGEPQTPSTPRVHKVPSGTLAQTLTIQYAEWSSRRIDVPRGVASSAARAVQIARTFGVKSRI
jgi:hypothetical protein